MKLSNNTLFALVFLINCSTPQKKFDLHVIQERHRNDSVKTELYVSLGTGQNPIDYRAIGYYENGQKEITFSVRGKQRNGLSKY